MTGKYDTGESWGNIFRVGTVLINYVAPYKIVRVNIGFIMDVF